MKKRNYAKTIVTAVLACSLCGGMITAYAGSDIIGTETQVTGIPELEETGGTKAHGSGTYVPYGVMEATGGSAESGLIELYNPIVDKKTGDVTFSYIEFGSYPQSEVTGEALTEEIINAEYVSGDAVVGGTKYRRVSVTNQAVTEQAVTGLVITEQTLTGEAVSGQNRYFKYEPIRWRLVHAQGGRAVLRTDKILDYQIYNANYETTGRYSGNWEGSVLQYWLNGYGKQANEAGFLQTAFSEQEKECIVETEIESDRNDAIDKVYILLYDEWVGSNYDVKIAAQVNTAVKSDFANIYSPNPTEKTGAWWLMKPAFEPYAGLIAYYNAKGEYCDRWFKDLRPGYDPEHFKAFMNSTEIGVCPAITVDLSKLGLYVKEIVVSEVPATKEPEFSNNPINSGLPKPSENPVISGSIDGSEQPTSAPIKSPEVSNTPLPSETVVKGDLDGNGKVDLSDAQLTLKAALKIMILDEAENKAADTDKDGKITLADAQNILKMALKIINPELFTTVP